MASIFARPAAVVLLAASAATEGRSMRRGLLAVVLLGAFGCNEIGPCDEQPGFVCLIAGTGELGYNRDGLPGPETDLFLPSSARRGPDGLIHIVDFNNQRLRVIDGDGTMQTVAGNGFHAFADVEADATDSPLENPIDFQFDSAGRMLFVSYHDPRVLEVTGDGGLVSLAGAADGAIGEMGDEGDGGPANEALFNQLDGIAIADDGTIYVSDSKTHRVRMIRDGIVDTVVGHGDKAYEGDGGPGVEASLNWPTALELDADGNLYIADAFNHAVRRLDPGGTITTVVGDGTPGYSGDGGPAVDARLNQPMGLAFDDAGNLYIGDRGNFAVRRVAPDGTITTIGGNGEEGASGDYGPAVDATFGYVARVAVDGDGLLVADQSNSKVRRIDLVP